MSLGKRLMQGAGDIPEPVNREVVIRESQQDSKKMSSFEEIEKRDKKEKKKRKEEVITINHRRSKSGR